MDSVQLLEKSCNGRYWTLQLHQPPGGFSCRKRSIQLSETVRQLRRSASLVGRQCHRSSWAILESETFIQESPADWEHILSDALLSIRALLSITPTAAPRTNGCSATQESQAMDAQYGHGLSLRAFTLYRRQGRQGKYSLADDVELMDSNTSYAHARFYDVYSWASWKAQIGSNLIRLGLTLLFPANLRSF